MKGEMTNKDFVAFRDAATKVRFRMCDEKSVEYTRGNADDRLCNFTRIGGTLVLPWEYVWSVYFLKHIDAIIEYVKTGKEGSEGIISRIHDAQNYLDLFLARIESMKEDQ